MNTFNVPKKRSVLFQAWLALGILSCFAFFIFLASESVFLRSSCCSCPQNQWKLGSAVFEVASLVSDPPNSCSEARCSRYGCTFARNIFPVDLFVTALVALNAATILHARRKRTVVLPMNG